MPKSRYVTATSLDARLRAWRAAVAATARPRPLPNLERAALLVVDVQRHFSAPSSHAHLPALEAVLPRIEALVDAFARRDRPVIFTRHVDDPDAPTLMQRWWRAAVDEGPMAALAAPLAGRAPDLLLVKRTYSAFHSTPLEAWLRERDCTSVVIAGVMTHLCVETSARHAFVLGFEPVVVADATCADDEAHHLGALCNLAHGFAVIASARELGAGELADDAERPQPPAVSSALLIAGGGPAGIAAALQAKRAGVETLLCAPEGLGGQLRAAERVENYPGFPGGIEGVRLAERMAAHLEVEGIAPLSHAVAAIGQAGARWRVQLDDGRQIEARAVIVATGATARELPQLPSELTLPYLDATTSLRGQRVAIVGGGEVAFDQALLACRLGAAQVHLVSRTPPRVLPRLHDRALALGVALHLGVPTGAERLPAGAIALELDAPARTIETERVVVCIGKDARLPGLPPTLLRRRDGTVACDDVGQTSAAGLYVAGDARRGPYRQAAIAAGDGLAAAMAVARWLQTVQA